MTTNHCGIYKITNNINCKCYIGQSINIEGRWMDHKKHAADGCVNKFYTAIRKYGWENFTKEIIEECPHNDEILNEREIYWIAFYDSFNNGYNMTIGGGGVRGLKVWSGRHHTEETRKKLSLYHKGTHLTEEHKHKIGESMLNKDWTDDQRKRMGAPHKGKHKSAEQRKKIGEANKGKHLSEETKQLLREKNLGKHPTVESRKKMSESHKGKPHNYTEEGRAKHLAAQRTPEARKHKSESNIGMIFLTNGIDTVRTKDTTKIENLLAQGWWQGMTRKSKKNTK